MTAIQLHTREEAARLLGVSPDWLKKQVAARRVPCRRLGRSVRFSDDDLRAITDAAAQPAIGRQS